MGFTFHSIFRAALPAITAFCTFAGPAASESPEPSAPGPVIVYSRADSRSSVVKRLESGAEFRIQMVLTNDSGRWCGVNDINGSFLGYAVCDQLESLKKKQSKKQRAQGEKRLPETVAREHAGKRAAKENAAKMPDKPDDTTGSFFVWLVLFAGFLFALAFGYLLRAYTNLFIRDLNGKRPGSAGQGDPVAESKRHARAAAAYRKGLVAKGRARAVHAGNLVKCQVCGLVQILAVDSRCSNDSCKATITSHLEDGQKPDAT